MIQQTTIPPIPALSGNPMPLALRVLDADSQPYRAVGSIATLTATNGSFLNADTFTISWTDQAGLEQSITFTAVASPTGINQVRATPLLLPQYEDIADKIQRHYIISPLFNISVVQDAPTTFTFTIEAVDPTHDYELAWDNSDLSGTTSVTAADPVLNNRPVDLAVYLDVFHQASYPFGQYTPAASLRATPGQDGRLAFDISHVIHAAGRYSQPTPPLPAFSAAVPVLAANLRNYYFRYREDYENATAQVRAWTYQGTNMALLGGLSQPLHAQFFDYLSMLDADSSLLSWYPDGKIVSPAQPEWLPWYNYTGDDKEIVLELVRYTDSATLSTLFRHENSLTIRANETALIPAGYTQLTIANANVLKYTVRVVDASSDYEGGSAVYLSPERTYYVDHNYYDSIAYLMYLNAFSCPETVRCIGAFTEAAQVERGIAQRTLGPLYSPTEAEELQYSEALQHRFTYRTGHLTKAEARALQELLLTRELHEVSTEGYIPLQLEEDSFAITETRQSLHSFTLRCRPRLAMKNYSGKPPMSTELGWRTAEGGFWLTAFGKPWLIAE